MLLKHAVDMSGESVEGNVAQQAMQALRLAESSLQLIRQLIK